MIKHLYDELAIRWYAKGGSVWLFSDPHFGDINSYKLRFPNIFPEEYVFTSKDVKATDKEGAKKALEFENRVKSLDEMQIKNINSKVHKNDTIIFLGDIGNTECIKKIKGYKVLIMGNHEKGASNYKRGLISTGILDCWRIQYKNGVCKSANKSNSLKDVEKMCEAEKDKIKEIVPIYTYEDNHLFDEVYEGPLMINDRVILSHEPIFPTIPFLFNIHGHVHNKNYVGDDHHLNVCAEAINYYPIHLVNFLKCGNISHIDSIHRMTIDGAIKRKNNKNK